MRVAEEILNSKWSPYNDKISDPGLQLYLSVEEIELIHEVINEARIEAINECRGILHKANRLLHRAYENNHDDMGWDNDYIQKLIDQVK